MSINRFTVAFSEIFLRGVVINGSSGLQECMLDPIEHLLLNVIPIYIYYHTKDYAGIIPGVGLPLNHQTEGVSREK